MTLSKRAAVCAAVFFAVAFIATASFAGTVFTDGTPYTDTNNITWEGTTYFTGVVSPQDMTPYPDLAGYVKWSVYAPGNFPFAGLSDEELESIADEYTYVYQVFGTGSDGISNFALLLDNAADNIGTFVDSANGFVCDPATLITTPYFIDDPASANWYFNGIGAGKNSQGLVYASTTAPLVHDSIVQDGGHVAFPIGIPAPGPYLIPEPGALALLIAGMGFALAMSRFRRR